VRFSVVFFDAGETLVHPYPSFDHLFATVLEREGFEVDRALVHDRLHVIGDRFRAAAEANELWTTSPERSRAFWRSVYEVFLGEVGLPVNGDLPDLLYREFTDLANYRLFEDVEPAIDELHRLGLRLGVISNFEAWLEQLLEHLAVTHRFEVVVISGVEGIEKPDPRIFRLAMERAGVEPDRSVYVGDNPELDVDAALAVGMYPVLIDRRGRYPDAPGVRIASLLDLRGALEAAA
jgi:putative hydrolase of the HAD superfamily